MEISFCPICGFDKFVGVDKKYEKYHVHCANCGVRGRECVTEEKAYVYVLYDEFYYSDVIIEVYAENLGKNTNNVSLVCNYSDRFGWYEFNISNGGLYDILIYSELDGGYFTLTSGGSKNVRTGRDANYYTAVCQGNQLALYVNGVLEKEFVDRKYNLREGQVGFGVSSFNVLPILVEVDYFAIDQP